MLLSFLVGTSACSYMRWACLLPSGVHLNAYLLQYRAVQPLEKANIGQELLINSEHDDNYFDSILAGSRS